MLIEFSVENFLSFQGRVTLSMLASSDTSLDHNYSIAQTVGNERVLRSAVIYGANASGKSNLLKALSFMRDFVVTNHQRQQGDTTGVTPFKLDNQYLDKPSQFEVQFVKDSVRYYYGFALDQEKVIKEYLYCYPKGRQSIVFERDKGSEFRFTKDQDEQKTLADRTLTNRLYLSVATEWNYKRTAQAFAWFKDKVQVIPLIEGEKLKNTIESLKDQKNLPLIRRFIAAADLGIHNVEASRKEIRSLEDLPSKMPDSLKAFLVEGRAHTLHIETYHYGLDEDGVKIEVAFGLEEESKGTLRMFEFVGYWLKALQEGQLLIVDELDTSLHPLLVQLLIEAFRDPLQNTNNAQLVFTTHDTNLLRLHTFRRDQIWFTEKNPDTGSTDVYSLLELRIRKDENVEKGYLAGRYGAIPFFGGGLSKWLSNPS